MNNKEMENPTMKDLEELELKFEEMEKVSGGITPKGKEAFDAFMLWKEKMQQKYNRNPQYKWDKDDRKIYRDLYMNFRNKEHEW